MLSKYAAKQAARRRSRSYESPREGREVSEVVTPSAPEPILEVEEPSGIESVPASDAIRIVRERAALTLAERRARPLTIEEAQELSLAEEEWVTAWGVNVLMNRAEHDPSLWTEVFEAFEDMLDEFGSSYRPFEALRRFAELTPNPEHASWALKETRRMRDELKALFPGVPLRKWWKEGHDEPLEQPKPRYPPSPQPRPDLAGAPQPDL